MRIQLAQRTEADDLLGRSPLALLVGMLLDQQIPMEWAFTGPHTISERLGHDLTAEEIAALDPEAFAALLAAKPAVHRYPKSMADRVQQLAAYLVEHYDGKPERLWSDAADGKELLNRLQGLPGLRQAEGSDIFGIARQADGGSTARMARGGRSLWRGGVVPFGRRCGRRRHAGRVRAAKQEAKQAAKAK